MKLLRTRCLTFIAIYSLLLLSISYLLDCRNKPRAPGEQPLFPRECPDASAPEVWADWGNATRTEAASGKGKQHIYLHATWRTGSSFAGELFNQHPAVFYLYEPMWLMWQALYPGDAESLHGAVRDMLRSLFRCDFSVLGLYVAAAGPLTTRSIFGWRNNKVICSAPLCGAYSKERVELVDGSVCERQCEARHIQELERECRRYQAVVIKDVRVLDAGVLFALMRDPSLNFKVVQLVRDPRAVHNSRMKSKQSLVRESIQVLRSKSKRSQRDNKGSWLSNRAQRAEAYVSKALEVICEAWSRDQALVKRSPDWVRARYLTVRYEDLVLDPLSSLRTLYTFANLTVTPATESYVWNMTRGVGYSSDRPFLISSRDAKEAVSAWKKRLSLWQIQQVEESCRTAMKMLGYSPSSVDNT
ncbi:carbohydrate sulfotransferase 7 [Rhincodon typus]|uniref:carbohydrate sulfotransferase 7 n=1 Tax=Rhincodon typus TaxID=259920 RepID=UPI0009A3FCCB|nr:carbohydrate sulfotransferase 7 [Rhincodon typus]